METVKHIYEMEKMTAFGDGAYVEFLAGLISFDRTGHSLMLVFVFVVCDVYKGISLLYTM